MSSYTFSLENLFDHKPTSDLSFSQFFGCSDSLQVPEVDQIKATNEDEDTLSHMSFEQIFEINEYRDEGLADIVMGNNCSRAHEDVCHFSPFEPAYEAPLVNQNAFISVSNNLRRACSTGDLLNFEPKNFLQTQRSFSDGLLQGGDSHRMRRYTAEQKQVSIEKYRAKRSQRNFNKTIKYECRKTLADNRPRIRGRFKRNEDTSDAQKSYEEDVIWMDRFHAVDCEENVLCRGHILNDYGLKQFEYPSSFS